MKIPGPDHPITVSPAPQRVRVHFNGHVVADSSRALVLQEANYPPVFYIPSADAEMALYQRTDHASHCPYKGDAGYYGLVVDGRRAENAVWVYEQPYPAVEAIRGRLAFYPNRVDRIETLPLGE